MNETDSVFFVTKLKVSTAEITFKLESPSRIVEMFLLSDSSLFGWLSKIIKNWTVYVIMRVTRFIWKPFFWKPLFLDPKNPLFQRKRFPKKNGFQKKTVSK